MASSTSLSSLRGGDLNISNGTASSGSLGYWGEPSATIDWCELNYQYSPYIAKFWNTLSNLLFVVLGTYGLLRSIHEGFEWRFLLLYISTIVIGVGSAMFHGTLLMVSQQLDETPMIWGVLIWVYIVYNDDLQALPFRKSTVTLSFVSIGAGFAALHAIYHFTFVFQLTFGAFAFVCFVRIVRMFRRTTDTGARAVCVVAMYAAVTGVVLWQLDYNLCDSIRALPVNPQGHAWWHVLMGIATYHAPLFLQFKRAEQQQKQAEITSTKWIRLQTIVIHDLVVTP